MVFGRGGESGSDRGGSSSSGALVAASTVATVATLIAPGCTVVNTDAVSTIFLKPQITLFQALFRKAYQAITS